MKTEKNILAAFILNLAFSIFEFFGGLYTGSTAIMSDALHDAGDALSIGISFALEKKSRKQPDKVYTYGYLRYSVMGSIITFLILLAGSAAVIYNAAGRIISPVKISYDGMIVFAVFGVAVNMCAAFVTHGGHSLNQKAVNLHMLEDVLGWVVVLVGAVVMKFTDFWFIDPIMSVCLAVFIVINAVKGLKEGLPVLLEKAPDGVDADEIICHLMRIDGVSGIHHVHIWSMDGENNYATMHVVTDSDTCKIKEKVRRELKEHGIYHATLELEAEGEHCGEKICNPQFKESAGHHHCHNSHRNCSGHSSPRLF